MSIRVATLKLKLEMFHESEIFCQYEKFKFQWKNASPEDAAQIKKQTAHKNLFTFW